MKIELKITLWALACAYALGNSFIYSWTFWTAFDINILQFASVTDIIPSIIYNLILPFAIVILTIVSAEIYARIKERIDSIIFNRIPPDLKNHKKIKHYLSILASSILPLVGVAISIYSIKIAHDRHPSEPLQWLNALRLIAPIILCFIIMHLIVTKTSFISEIKYRVLIIICLCLVPAASYFWAAMNSQFILNGKDTFLVKSDTQCKSSPDTQFRYISSISDKAFALSLKDGSICIFKYNTLELTPEVKKQFTRAMDSNLI